ncbi:MAG TPA: glycosyltransferase family 4 protein [Ferrovibrio sp.]|uniref:glycosyltransferase family 4 protein n=1 Tax=Ferrovibrio sp. TaxID=1917215 RepID=UPI002ED09F81
MIRVLHVSPTDGDGGAAVGAYNLHKAVQQAGIDSTMLVLRKYGRDPSVVTRRGTQKALLDSLRDPLDRLPLQFYRWEPHNWWSVGWLPFDIKATVDRLRPDIVHFHWAGRGAVPIRTIARLQDYPLVWTLRDMWPLTGGCHYAGECSRYTSGCGSCPQLGSRSDFDISRWQWRRKHRYWRDAAITFVPLSNWMAACARQSPLTFKNEITVIPNGVNVDRFKPLDQAMARAVWGLPMDRKVVLFGALHGVKDPRKGFGYLAKALRLLMAQGWEDRLIAVAFGGEGGDDQLGFPIRYVGRLHDDVSIALLYACADVMVVPSIYENAAKTALEAMSCGTPVAAFANTGQVDIVDHKINGYLAENLSADDLARGIAWCLEHGGPGSALSQQAREKVLRHFDISKIARQHVALYERLLAEHSKVSKKIGEESANDAEALPYAVQDGLARSNDGSIS